MEHLTLTIAEYIEKITSTEPQSDLTELVSFHPIFCQSVELIKLIHARLLLISKNESKLYAYRAPLVRLGACVLRCIKFLWSQNIDLVYHNGGDALLTNLLEDYNKYHPKACEAVMGGFDRMKSGDYDPKLVFIPPKPAVLVTDSDRTKPLLEISTEEIARQITLLDWEFFSSISGLAVIYEVQKDFSPAMSCERDPLEKQAENITKLRQQSLNLTNMVIGSILNSSTIEECKPKVSKFDKLAQHLLELNNLNSYLAVVDALESFYVHSLNITEITSKSSDVAPIFTKESSSTLDPPIVWPLGDSGHWKDVYFHNIRNILYDPCRPLFHNNKINFNAVEELRRAAQKMDYWHSRWYNLQSVPWLQDKILLEQAHYKQSNFFEQYQMLRNLVKVSTK